MPEHDHRFDQVISQEAGADQVFVVGFLVPPVLFFRQLGLASKENALRHDDDRLAVRLERLRDMLHPGIVGIVSRRHSVTEPVIRIAVREVVKAPNILREWRSQNDAIKLFELLIASEILRRSQAVANYWLP